MCKCMSIIKVSVTDIEVKRHDELVPVSKIRFQALFRNQ